MDSRVPPTLPPFRTFVEYTQGSHPPPLVQDQHQPWTQGRDTAHLLHPLAVISKLTRLDWTQEDDEALIDMRKKGMSWREIGKSGLGRTYEACRARHQNLANGKEMNVRHAIWTLEEDDTLFGLLRNKNMDWNSIAKSMQGRSSKACQSRYPVLMKSRDITWTLEDDNLLIKLRDSGKSWLDIAELIPGRLFPSYRRRYNTLKIPRG